MNFAGWGMSGQTNMQYSLSMASGGMHVPCSGPHHPITCHGDPLRFEEDDTLHCPHGHSYPGCDRTQAALNASVAVLLFEELFRQQGGTTGEAHA